MTVAAVDSAAEGVQAWDNVGMLDSHARKSRVREKACLRYLLCAAVIPLRAVTWQKVPDPFSAPKVRRILYGTSMLWVIGVATIAIKKPRPRKSTLICRPRGRNCSRHSAPKRLMVILNVYWLNLKTLFWPRGLGLWLRHVQAPEFLGRGGRSGRVGARVDVCPVVEAQAAEIRCFSAFFGLVLHWGPLHRSCRIT